ncbi:hypothetical protein ACNH6B_06665 [Shewanella basaltis]|uniref:hypothetical protein n=1 Tax=Shewanella basaltis TaxID=472183 RepID=UPI003AAC67A2
MGKQLVFILLGFFIGQGSMFIVQTYLVIVGDYKLIADLGIALGLVSLLQWIADGGGVYFLSKYDKEKELFNIIGVFVLARLMIGLLFMILVFVPIIYFELLSKIGNDIIIYSPLVVIVWAFNLTGVADSRTANKYLGPLSGLSWFFSSLVIVFFHESDLVGLSVGAAFCIGLVMTVIFQMHILEVRYARSFFIFSFFDFSNMVRLIFGYSSAYFSSQGYARAIPIIINNAIDPMVAGVYIYAKGLINSVGQIIVFSRRVEFNNLVSSVSVGFNFSNVIKSQKISFFISILSFVVISFFYIFSLFVDFFYAYRLVFEFVFILSVIQFFWVVTSSMSQVLVVLGQTRVFSLVVFFTCLTSILFVYYGISVLGVYSVYISEFFMLLVQMFFYLKVIKNSEMCYESKS